MPCSVKVLLACFNANETIVALLFALMQYFSVMGTIKVKRRNRRVNILDRSLCAPFTAGLQADGTTHWLLKLKLSNANAKPVFAMLAFASSTPHFIVLNLKSTKHPTVRLTNKRIEFPDIQIWDSGYVVPPGMVQGGAPAVGFFGNTCYGGNVAPASLAVLPIFATVKALYDTLRYSSAPIKTMRGGPLGGVAVPPAPAPTVASTDYMLNVRTAGVVDNDFAEYQ
ncbi:1 TM domain-containing transmembrane protein [Acrasis kona]|uniref:1 TM domain-containing transmembrane protein n=1 Tax=Acrasis kona TaxID=1008807 RepID=A0AAW2ZPC3_9EUKA